MIRPVSTPIKPVSTMRYTYNLFKKYNNEPIFKGEPKLDDPLGGPKKDNEEGKKLNVLV